VTWTEAGLPCCKAMVCGSPHCFAVHWDQVWDQLHSDAHLQHLCRPATVDAHLLTIAIQRDTLADYQRVGDGDCPITTKINGISVDSAAESGV
jgi:hypothetical protein